MAALFALRSRRLLPITSSLACHHFIPSSVTPCTQSSPISDVFTFAPFQTVQFQSRLFQSTPMSMYCSAPQGKEEEKLDPRSILFAGCDYNHWMITIDFPKNPKPTAEEMVDTYVQTCAKGLNISEEEAKKRIYACSTTTYKGFQAIMTEEESKQFRALPNVVFILPDSYIDHVTKEYGGDKYINGTIIPRPLRAQQLNRHPSFPRKSQKRNFRNTTFQGGMQNVGPGNQFPVRDREPGMEIQPVTKREEMIPATEPA